MFLHRREKGFSAVELIITIVVISIAIVLLLPLLAQSRCKGSRFMANNTQLRGIHQGFVRLHSPTKKAGTTDTSPA